MRLLIFLFLIFPTILSATELKIYEIRGEEIWEGEKIIDGIVAVREKGKLIIKPGTKIYFLPIDIDNDEIGDSELYVEGEIYVFGERDRPVIFTAKSDKIEPKLWKYVMVNHARYAYFKDAVFEGAFSGLQVHFSKADIKNCLFRKNIDGFRFSTANISVCNSIMMENRHGIRYEERDSKGVIHFNEIRNNEIGIFPVIKVEGKVIFQYNNIYQNEYNIKIGDEQKRDISFQNNYFGSDIEVQIRKSIYDKGRDKNLPSVKIKPFLRKKVSLGEDKCLEKR